MCPRFLSHLVFAALVGCTAGRVGAQVAARSPFLPPQGATTKAATEGAPLEYRGFIETAQGLQYRIYDPAKKAGAWIRIDQKHADFDVLAKQYDNDQKTLTIEHAGRTLTLAERKPKIVSSGNAAQAMPPPPQNPQPTVAPAVTQSVVLNPTPADEQRRLEAVAAEVARRRALREQATQQITQGNAPQVAIPQPQVQPMQQNLQQPQPGALPGAPASGRGPNPPVRQQR